MRKYIPKDILYVCILAGILIVARILLFHSLYLAYMLWNIFLAILPFVMSSLLLWYWNKNRLSVGVFVVGGIIWLLLLPNAPYMVTDLIHLGRGHDRVPILFDAFLLFSTAWLGILLFTNSLFHIETILLQKYGKPIARIKIPSLLLLTSIGVYIGRYLRFNSWDVFVDPTFFGSTWQGVAHPVNLTEAVLFIVTCFISLSLAYMTWKSTRREL